ncbi:MAG: TnsA endonuclease N-terminal domain-containing protein [Fermentimonas sp.]|nr:TnsA endonuclease N-terminal domain-containing protein [Fermentimonas sp.]
MSKRKYGETPQSQQRWIKEGRGSGIGEKYKPWLTIHDVPSSGGRHRIDGIKINRAHHLLSNLEKDYFYILEFSDSVVDIREQFSLFTLEETLAIAQEIGLKHPIDPHTNCHKMITTDFLITINNNGEFIDLARTVKQWKDLMDERQMEKFEIERIYWKRKGVDWGIVTEKEINSNLAMNIGNIRGYKDISHLDGYSQLSKKNKKLILDKFTQEICGSGVIVRDVAFKFDEKMALPIGTSLSLFKHLLVNKIIFLDMEKKLDFDSPQYISKQKLIENGVSVG